MDLLFSFPATYSQILMHHLRGKFVVLHLHINHIILHNSAQQSGSICIYRLTAHLQPSINNFLIIIKPFVEKIEFIVCEC